MPEVKRTIVFRDSLAVKLTMERVLRELMSTDIVEETYRYSSVDKDSQIRIYRSYPKRIEFYPSIVLFTGSHDVDIQTLSDEKEIASEKYENGILTSETFTGYTRIPIIVKVYAKSGDDRDKIISILVMFLRVLARNSFVEFGINKIRVGEDQHMEQDRAMIYSNTITVWAHTDYTQVLTTDQTLLIDKVVAEIIPVEVIT
jgi:hypothetical protein